MSRYKKSGAVMSKTDWNNLMNSHRYEQIDNRRAISQRIDAWNKGPVQGPNRPSSSPRATWRSPIEDVARRNVGGSGPVLHQYGDVTLNQRQMDKLAKAQRAIDRAYGAGAAAARGARMMQPFARAALSGVRAIEWAMDLADMLPNYITKPGSATWDVPSGWTLRTVCPSPIGPTNAQSSLYGQELPNYGLCLGGQYVDWVPQGTPVGPYHRTVAYGYGYYSNINLFIALFNFHRVYTRNFWDVNTAQTPKLVTSPATSYRPDNVMLNPNVVRAMPGEINLEAIIHAPSIDPVLAAFPSVMNVVADGTTPATLVSTVRVPGGPPFNGGTIVGNPGARNPPAKGEHTRKYKGPLGRVLAVSDAVSEGSEVVDAFYEALPKKVKDNWDCNRNAAFIDSAGQYGISNADCKLGALWHNWHKVDMNRAVQNLVANYIEDKVVGGIQRMIPRNTINAVQDGEKLVSKALDELFKSVGLQE